jgi:hypothetical protein
MKFAKIYKKREMLWIRKVIKYIVGLNGSATALFEAKNKVDPFVQMCRNVSSTWLVHSRPFFFIYQIAKYRNIKIHTRSLKPRD